MSAAACVSVLCVHAALGVKIARFKGLCNVCCVLLLLLAAAAAATANQDHQSNLSFCA
jgi:hypothetical protein